MTIGSPSRPNRTPRGAFTLIELVVTIAILAVLAAVGVVAYSHFVSTSRISASSASAAALRTAISANAAARDISPAQLVGEMWAAHAGDQPAFLAALGAGSAGGDVAYKSAAGTTPALLEVTTGTTTATLYLPDTVSAPVALAPASGTSSAPVPMPEIDAGFEIMSAALSPNGKYFAVSGYVPGATSNAGRVSVYAVNDGIVGDLLYTDIHPGAYYSPDVAFNAASTKLAAAGGGEQYRGYAYTYSIAGTKIARTSQLTLNFLGEGVGFDRGDTLFVETADSRSVSCVDVFAPSGNGYAFSSRLSADGDNMLPSGTSMYFAYPTSSKMYDSWGRTYTIANGLSLGVGAMVTSDGSTFVSVKGTTISAFQLSGTTLVRTATADLPQGLTARSWVMGADGATVYVNMSDGQTLKFAAAAGQLTAGSTFQGPSKSYLFVAGASADGSTVTFVDRMAHKVLQFRVS